MKSNLKFISLLWKYSMKSVLVYRVNFIIQAGATVVNNSIYFIFWLVFFSKIISVETYSLNDMLMQFSIVTAAFGIAYVFFGNSSGIAGIVINGELDYYMLFPRNILLYLVTAKFYLSSMGDFIFGVLILFYLQPNIRTLLPWLFCVITGAIIIVMLNVILGSLSFWLGNVDQLSRVISEAIVTFSLYPNNIYKGVIKIVLLTIIPSGYLGNIPLHIIQDGNLIYFVFLIAFTFMISFIGVSLFYIGLKRYESSNLFSVNM